MFKWPIIFSLSIIGIFGILIVYHVVTIHPSDRILYQKIQQQTQLLRSSQSLERSPSTQLRKDARKDIWTQDRVHFQMNADHSKLTLKQKKDKVEASEELENIICENPVGKIIAKQGTFEYPEQHFLATQVTCTHSLGILEAQTATLQSPDETLVLDNGVDLKASDFSLHAKKAICEVQDRNQQIKFSQDIVFRSLFGAVATGDQAIYQADHLNLYSDNNACHLHYLTHLLKAKVMVFDLKNQTILCMQPEGIFEKTLQFMAESLELKKETMTLSNHVHLEQENSFSIDADTCHITLNEKSPTRIEISNNVRFFSPQEKELYALADQINYYPQEQTLIFTAHAPKRVLFWQGGTSISAPEIRIHKELIQGIGDVRFTFNLEEQGLIDEHISKYLYFPFLN